MPTWLSFGGTKSIGSNRVSRARPTEADQSSVVSLRSWVPIMRVMMITTAQHMAEPSGNRAATCTAEPPGRMMISTPSRPTRVAAQRLYADFLAEQRDGEGGDEGGGDEGDGGGFGHLQLAQPGHEQDGGAEQGDAADDLHAWPLRPDAGEAAAGGEADAEQDEDHVAQPGDLDRRQRLAQEFRHGVGDREEDDRRDRLRDGDPDRCGGLFWRRLEAHPPSYPRWADSRRPSGRIGQRFALTSAKAAPWGSRHWMIQAPPGTSCGPWNTRPPASWTRRTARSMPSTTK